MKFVLISIIVIVTSIINVNAQTDLFDGRNMEKIYVDSSAAPYVTATYELDLKSNTTEDGITKAFVILTVKTKFEPITTALNYEIKCDERLIRFATAIDITLENGKLTMSKIREIDGSVFANPYTDRGMKSSKRGAFKAIIAKSCATEL